VNQHLRLPHLGAQSSSGEDDPRRDITIGAAVVAAFLVLFLGWGSTARLDAAAVAPGQVTVTGHRQTLQHREGGIVSAIHVAEGQHVAQGQVLIELAGAEVKATEQALSAQAIHLQAARARLQAEQLGLPSIQWPADFATLRGLDQQVAQQAMAIQQTQFVAHARALQAQKNVLGQKSAEIGQLVRGYQSQIAAADRQQSLLGDELKGMQSLADRGFAPMNKVRELQRYQAQISGQRGQYEATIAQSREQAGEDRLQILQVAQADSEKVASDLHDVETDLAEVRPKLDAAKDQLARSEIRSPVAGTVVGLSVFTVGGVIAPGQRLLDVVPDEAPLLIEARVSPNDVQDLRTGQLAEVKFPSLHDRGLPILNGRLLNVSADSLSDQRTGARYYTAEVSVPVQELNAIERKRTEDFALRPGMPVEVVVPLHKRTALQFLLEPLVDALWNSFREQ
jgi:HlyD family secretion protein